MAWPYIPLPLMRYYIKLYLFGFREAGSAGRHSTIHMPSRIARLRQLELERTKGLEYTTLT